MYDVHARDSDAVTSLWPINLNLGAPHVAIVTSDHGDREIEGTEG